MTKPSQTLRRAAQLVTAYRDRDETVTSDSSVMFYWEYGCHAISCAAFEAGVLTEQDHTGQAVVFDSQDLEKKIPHIFSYFKHYKPVDLEKWRCVWFYSPNERIDALLKAADDAEKAGE